MFGKSEYYAYILLYELKGISFVGLDSIAQKYDISASFLYKIAGKLKTAGLITSKEGVKGGYMLAMDGGAVTLYDIMHAVHTVFAKNILCNCSVGCVKRPVCTKYTALTESLYEDMKLLYI